MMTEFNSIIKSLNKSLEAYEEYSKLEAKTFHNTTMMNVIGRSIAIESFNNKYGMKCSISLEDSDKNHKGFFAKIKEWFKKLAAWFKKFFFGKKMEYEKYKDLFKDIRKTVINSDIADEIDNLDQNILNKVNIMVFGEEDRYSTSFYIPDRMLNDVKNISFDDFIYPGNLDEFKNISLVSEIIDKHIEKNNRVGNNNPVTDELFIDIAKHFKAESIGMDSVILREPTKDVIDFGDRKFKIQLTHDGDLRFEYITTKESATRVTPESFKFSKDGLKNLIDYLNKLVDGYYECVESISSFSNLEKTVMEFERSRQGRKKFNEGFISYFKTMVSLIEKLNRFIDDQGDHLKHNVRCIVSLVKEYIRAYSIYRKYHEDNEKFKYSYK